jgi:tyrosyl-tRNA synthetase
MPLLRGTDGSDKMSKSLGNYIGLADDPRDMYGKVMAIPDSLIDEYLRLAASLSAKEQAKMRAALANGENPMEIKKAIAANIVEQYHSAKAAADAAEFFRRQFQSRDAQAAEYAEVVKFAPFVVVLGRFERDGEVRNVVSRRLKELQVRRLTHTARSFR